MGVGEHLCCLGQKIYFCLILCRFCAGNTSCYQFMSVSALSCIDDSFHWNPDHLITLTYVQSPLPWCFLSLWERGIDKICWYKYKHLEGTLTTWSMSKLTRAGSTLTLVLAFSTRSRARLEFNCVEQAIGPNRRAILNGGRYCFCFCFFLKRAHLF